QSADKHIFKFGVNYLFNAGLSSASAADFAVKAPAPIAAPFSWTGFYIGANAGGGVLFDSFAFGRGIGALAGGQIGGNYQIGMLVLGAEAEGFWSGMNGRLNDQEPGFSLTRQTRNKWDADIAARFGLAFSRALVYGKAGWVVGQFDRSSEDTNQI